jgi:hypothetical protein
MLWPPILGVHVVAEDSAEVLVSAELLASSAFAHETVVVCAPHSIIASTADAISARAAIQRVRRCAANACCPRMDDLSARCGDG